MAEMRSGSGAQTRPGWWPVIGGIAVAILGHGLAIGAAWLPYEWYDAGTKDLDGGGGFAAFWMMLCMFAVGQGFLLGCGFLISSGFGVPRFSLGLMAGWAGGLALILGIAVVGYFSTGPG
ncbi:hypothetical protein OG470_27900 [Micromonospora sp. NBC_00389]|uniref:hypothetical protein n=1 Tax=Micromonospora sp. NBC_00389 TaxID=2903586 RepID=UPI002E22AAD4